MNTCVLCLRRRNAFECTMRSRSRWNGVRSGESGSGRTRLAGYERVASGESQACSHAWARSWKWSAATVTVAMGLVLIVPGGEAEKLAPGDRQLCASAACAAATRATGTRYG